jgi:hypothetical protein
MSTGSNEVTSNSKAKATVVLSRASVYAPLKSYDNPAAADSEPSSVPKNLQDAQLVQFYSKVSEHFHRSNPRLDCKNTAGRPLSVADITGRIQQRALTLIGGGYNVSATTASATSKEKSQQAKNTVVSRRQLKRKRHRILERIGCSGPSPEQRSHNANFLQQLNAQWNVYATKVLQVPTDEILNLSQISIRARQLAGSIEWVGARVRVDHCVSAKSREGLLGILVSQTTNTWRIVPAVEAELVRTASLTEDTVNSNAISNECPLRLNKTVIVPKDGSSLAVLIPLSNRSNSDWISNKPRYLSIVVQQSKAKSTQKPI